MSGGKWDYNQFQATGLMRDVAEDTSERFPVLSQIHRDLASLMDQVWHDLDWDFSCDSTIEDDKEFEEMFVRKLKDIISKNG